MPTQIPIADNIFRWPSSTPRLLASRCTSCGTHVFPVQDGCPRCAGESSETVELATTGKLWTWTVQGFPPPSPPYIGSATFDDFRPFGVGYVELEAQLRVETRLTVSDPDLLEVGMDMELVFEPLGVDDDGNEIVTFAFAPAAQLKQSQTQHGETNPEGAQS